MSSRKNIIVIKAKSEKSKQEIIANLKILISMGVDITTDEEILKVMKNYDVTFSDLE